MSNGGQQSDNLAVNPPRPRGSGREGVESCHQRGRARPPAPTGNRPPSRPEDHLLGATMGVGDAPTGRHDRPRVQAVCWLHGAGAWSSEWDSQLPQGVRTEGQGAVPLPRKCPLPLHPLLSAAAPGPPSLFRDVCADKAPSLRVTRSQDSVTCQVGR